jgi:hypothetical protein
LERTSTFGALRRVGFGVLGRRPLIRSPPVLERDTNALYPRSNQLMRWLELCAVWCCDGWRSGTPRFLKLVNEGYRIFSDVLVSDEKKLSFRRDLLRLLWEQRDTKVSLHQWLQDIRRDLVSDLISEGRTLDDDGVVLDTFIERTGSDGDVSDMTLGLFSGFGEGSDRIILSTLHSAKGREFAIVVLFGMDDGLFCQR